MPVTTTVRRSHPIDVLHAQAGRAGIVSLGSVQQVLSPDPNGVLDANGRLWVPWSMAKWAAHHAQVTLPGMQELWMVRQSHLMSLRLLPSSRLAAETCPYSLYEHRDGAWQRCVDGRILGNVAATTEATQPWLALAEAASAVQEVIRTLGAKVNVGVRNMTLNFGSF